MSNTLALWHPGVHRRIRERLYYFFVRVERYFLSNFQKYFLTEVAQPLGLASYCLYELYGTFDVVIRVWITPIDLDKLVTLLGRKAKAVAEFAVDTVELWWCFPDLRRPANPEAWQDITKESLIMAQQGDENLRQRFVKAGLLFECHPSPDGDRIKFFVGISQPAIEERIALDRLISDTKDVILGNACIHNQSLYTGTGSVWALVKATTDSPHSIRGLVENLARRLEPYGSRTTTYLVATPTSLETDGIGQGTLAALDAWDPAIDAWLPELYRDLLPSAELKLDIEKCLKPWVKKVTFVNEDEIQLQNFFRAIVHCEKPVAAAFAMELFARIEYLLREKLGRYLAHLYGPTEVAARLTQFGMPFEPRRMTLKEILGTYKRALQDRCPQEAERLLPKNPDQIESCRNGLAHGWKDALESWREVANSLFEIVVKGRQLAAFVDEEVLKSL